MEYTERLVKEHADDAAAELINAGTLSAAIAHTVADSIADEVNAGDSASRLEFLDRWLSDIGAEIVTRAS